MHNPIQNPILQLFETKPRNGRILIEAPTDSVETKFFERIFPIDDRVDSEELLLPPKFSELIEFMLQTLPSAENFRNSKIRSVMYSSHEACISSVKSMYVDHSGFVQRVVRTNLDLAGQQLNDPELIERFRTKLTTYASLLPDFTFQRPKALGLELHGKSDQVVRSILEQSTYNILEAMVQKLVQSFEVLVSMEFMQLLEWVFEDAFRTHGYSAERLPANGKTSKATDSTPQIVHERVVREMLCGSNYLLSAVDFAIPKEIRDLITHAPVYLKPAMRIIKGIETRKSVIQRLGDRNEKSTQVSEEYTYQPYFGLVLGHFVLATWQEQPIEQHAEQHNPVINSPKRLNMGSRQSLAAPKTTGAKQ